MADQDREYADAGRLAQYIVKAMIQLGANPNADGAKLTEHSEAIGGAVVGEMMHEREWVEARILELKQWVMGRIGALEEAITEINESVSKLEDAAADNAEKIEQSQVAISMLSGRLDALEASTGQPGNDNPGGPGDASGDQVTLPGGSAYVEGSADAVGIGNYTATFSSPTHVDRFAFVLSKPSDVVDAMVIRVEQILANGASTVLSENTKDLANFNDGHNIALSAGYDLLDVASSLTLTVISFVDGDQVGQSVSEIQYGGSESIDLNTGSEPPSDSGAYTKILNGSGMTISGSAGTLGIFDAEVRVDENHPTHVGSIAFRISKSSGSNAESVRVIFRQDLDNGSTTKFLDTGRDVEALEDGAQLSFGENDTHYWELSEEPGTLRIAIMSYQGEEQLGTSYTGVAFPP